MQQEGSIFCKSSQVVVDEIIWKCNRQFTLNKLHETVQKSLKNELLHRVAHTRRTRKPTTLFIAIQMWILIE